MSETSKNIKSYARDCKAFGARHPACGGEASWELISRLVECTTVQLCIDCGRPDLSQDWLPGTKAFSLAVRREMLWGRGREASTGHKTGVPLGVDRCPCTKEGGCPSLTHLSGCLGGFSPCVPPPWPAQPESP